MSRGGVGGLMGLRSEAWCEGLEGKKSDVGKWWGLERRTAWGEVRHSSQTVKPSVIPRYPTTGPGASRVARRMLCLLVTRLTSTLIHFPAPTP